MSTLLTHARLIRLRVEDMERIAELERRSFVPALQAAADDIARRFAAGHTMLGMEAEGRLIALLAYYYHHFDLDHPQTYPRTLAELTERVSVDEPDALYLYNLEVDPSQRGRGCARRMLRHAFVSAARDGCVQGVANCRVPSYPRRPRLRAAIDHYLEGGRFPEQSVLCTDPTLALYHRITGCRFVEILPDFAPQDHETGGLRVIAHGTRADVLRPKHIDGETQ